MKIIIRISTDVKIEKAENDAGVIQSALYHYATQVNQDFQAAIEETCHALHVTAPLPAQMTHWDTDRDCVHTLENGQKVVAIKVMGHFFIPQASNELISKIVDTFATSIFPAKINEFFDRFNAQRVNEDGFSFPGRAGRLTVVSHVWYHNWRP